MFVQLGPKLVNTSLIRTIEVQRQRDRRMAFVEYTDGTETSFEVSSSFDEGQLTRDFIPAPPGYTLVTYLEPAADDHDGSLWRDPIIAFKYEGDVGSVTPVTLEGRINDDSNNIAILMPDGRVSILMDRTYENEKEFLAAMDTQFRARTKAA
jgi:hypothetical protein